jgi:hypothetical protein
LPTKINIVLDDDVKADLYELVESGKRSRVVNAALRREILAIRRQRANATLERLRASTGRVATAELVELVRRDRRRRA